MAVRNPDFRREAPMVSDLVARARLLANSGERNSDEVRRIRQRINRLRPRTAKGLRQYLGDLIVEGSPELDNGFKHELFFVLFGTKATHRLFDLMGRGRAILGEPPDDYSNLGLIRQIKAVEQQLAFGKLAKTKEALDFIRSAEIFLRSPIGQQTGRFKKKEGRSMKPVRSAEVLTEARADLELQVETENQELLAKATADLCLYLMATEAIRELQEEGEISLRRREAWRRMDEARLYLPKIIRLIPRVQKREFVARLRLFRWEYAMRGLRMAEREGRPDAVRAQSANEQKVQWKFVRSARQWRRWHAYLASLEAKVKALEPAVMELCSLKERDRELTTRMRRKNPSVVEPPRFDNALEAKLRLAREYQIEAEELRRRGKTDQAGQLERVASAYFQGGRNGKQ